MPGKNTVRLGDHPLLAYSIAAARRSGVFDDVVVSTDSDEIAAIARHYGADVPFLRPASMALDESPDIDWVRHALDALHRTGRHHDAFSILRPTSPFRQPSTIDRAWRAFVLDATADSIRAVERVSQHPGKMWRLQAGRLVPILPVQPAGAPWHSQPTQRLPEVYVQNASLEIAWSRCVTDLGSISGEAIVAFVTDGHEGLDINAPADLAWARHLVDSGHADLPVVDVAPWRG